MSADPLVGLEEGAKVRVSFADGRVLTGSSITISRQHFVVCRGPGMPLQGHTEGPLEQMEVLSVVVVQTRAEVLAEGRRWRLGEPVPGREPVTGEDFRQRLQILARAVAQEPAWQREMQIRGQFDAVADRISLAAGKRAWVLAEGKWALRSNASPTLADLWGDAVASPSCFARPGPRDFDPDPVVRRRRTAVPAAVRADPHSIRNMLAALKGQGLKVRLTRLGDPPEDRGNIEVNMPIKGGGRFVAIAHRALTGRMNWRLVWGGNTSTAGLRRKRQAEATDDYDRLVSTIALGRDGIQIDLSANGAGPCRQSE